MRVNTLKRWTQQDKRLLRGYFRKNQIWVESKSNLEWKLIANIRRLISDFGSNYEQ